MLKKENAHWRHVLRAVAALALLLPLASGAVADGGGGNDATVSTDKAVYVAGDAVTITFVNHAAVPVALPSKEPWRIADAHGLLTVYAPTQTFGGDFVAPGENRTYVWRLVTDAGEPAPPGDYTARVSMYTSSGEAVEVAAAFRACTAPRAAPWGAVDVAVRALRCA